MLRRGIDPGHRSVRVKQDIIGKRARELKSVLQNPEDAGHFILYEAYISAEAAAAHKQTAHYALWRDTVAVMMAAPRQGLPMIGLFPRD